MHSAIRWLRRVAPAHRLPSARLLVGLSGLVILSWPVHQPVPNAFEALHPGQPVARTIAPGETQSIALDLAASEFARLRLEGRGRGGTGRLARGGRRE